MKLDEFSIRSYGRLDDTGVVNIDKNISLIKAEHGTGKTLMIDSLIKMMFGRNERGAFKEVINRVNEEPSGYLKVKDNDKNTTKLPEQGRITDWDLEPRDFKNIFVIHSGDLFLDDESPYYRSVSERIIGLRTTKISDAKEAIENEFTLTPKRKGYRNIAGNNQLRDRLNDVPSLLEEIEDLKEEMSSKDLEDYEVRINKIQEKIEEMEKERKKLNNARKGKQYKKGSEALESLKNCLNELENYKEINNEDFTNFKEARNNMEKIEEEISSLENKIEGLRDNLEEKKEEHDQIERNLENLKKREEKVDEELKPKLSNFEDLEQDFAPKAKKEGFYRKTGYLSFVTLIISLLGSIVSSSFITISYIFVLPVIISWIQYFRIIRGKSNLAGKFEEIRAIAKRMGIDGQTAAEIYSQIDDFKNSLQERKSKERDISENINSLETEIEGKENRLEKIKEEMEGAEDKIEEIKERAGVDNFEEYKENLKRKNDLEEDVNGCKKKLVALFGKEAGENYDKKAKDFVDCTVKEIKDKVDEVHDQSFLDAIEKVEMDNKNRKTAIKAIKNRKKELPKNDNSSELGKLIDHWSKELKKINEFEEAAEDINFEEEKLESLEKGQEEKVEEKEKLKEEIDPLREDFRDVERKANKILNPDDNETIPCETLVDIKKIEDRLENFKEQRERDLENALKAKKIFEEIEEEERKEVPKILGKASKYFSEITKGRFEDVKLDSEEMELKVKERGRERFRSAERLSAAEKDQLYFSVRLVLAEELIGDEKGFFILDDPFVKLSPNALKTVFNTLREIGDKGWQILYFTAKGDVAEELSNDIESGNVQKIPAPSIK